MEASGRRRTDTRSPTRLRRDLVLIGVVGLGGVLGALARDTLETTAPATSGQLPWTTLGINVTGSLGLGFLLVLLAERYPTSRLLRPLLGTGVIGAFTTFSTYMLETFQLIRTGHQLLAGVYLVVSLLGGLLAVAAGIAAARLLIRAERRWQERS